jgi:hypothetical protein
MRRTVLLVTLTLPLAARLAAQDHAHTEGMTHGATAAAPAPAATGPTMPGQDAYGAIAEIVRLLEADSTTDWSRVNLEGLRQHLIDMYLVTLGATVRQTEVPGGMQAVVTGTGRTVDAIRRMSASHGGALGEEGYDVRTAEIPGGARMTIVAASRDARSVARIRGLGFIGLLTVGAHHAPHHLALARGEPMSHAH